jgi:hypothetical protein
MRNTVSSIFCSDPVVPPQIEIPRCGFRNPISQPVEPWHATANIFPPIENIAYYNSNTLPLSEISFYDNSNAVPPSVESWRAATLQKPPIICVIRVQTTISREAENCTIE